MTALLAACSSAPGPLGDGGTAGNQCMTFPQGKPVTTGLYDLHNSGTSPVTIKDRRPAVQPRPDDDHALAGADLPRP